LGLAHALERGLVHRDVKPANLMLTPQGQVKVLDFGLASLAAEQGGGTGGLTEVGQGMGTPDYMAPEQIRDAHSVDARADVYSLGCTLYFLLTGQPPFPGGNSAQKMAAHLEKQPTPLRQLRPGLPAGLVQVVERMMAKAPARRYQTPAEVVAALEPFCRPAQTPRRRRSRLGWMAIAAGLLLALGGLLWGVFWVQTEYGTLEITTVDPNVEILVKKQGRVVQILDLKAKRTFELYTGTYELELSENGRDLELSSNQFTLTREGKTIAVVKRRPKESSPGPVGAQPLSSDPLVLTVSKKPEKGAQFQTITEALDKVKPGMTIRVLDDAVYEEYLLISNQHRGIVLEAVGKASIRRLPGKPQAVDIRSVSDFTLRGFRFASPPDDNPHCQVFIVGLCPGVVLDRLDLMTGGHACVDLYGVPLSGKDTPIVIRNCTMRGGARGVCLEGADRDNLDRPLPCGHVVIRDNTMVGCGDAVELRGAAQKVQVVGNRIADSKWNAIELFDLLHGTADILVANNTLLRCTAAVVIKDDHSKGKDFLKCKNIRIHNNLVLAPGQVADLWFLDHTRGDQQKTRPSDLPALLTSPEWHFSHNWREIDPMLAAARLPTMWIPLCPNDHAQVPIEVLSRTVGDSNFLRPAKDSPLATGGAGGSLPAYVGAVPPEGVPPWDWDKTWQADLSGVQPGDKAPDLSKAELILDDDFDPAKSSFPKDRNDRVGYERFFEKGRYVISQQLTQGATWGNVFHSPTDAVTGDVACQVVGRVLPEKDTGWAVGFWIEGRDRDLGVRLRRDGAVEVGNFFWAERSPPVTTVGPIRHPAIHPGNEDNTLLVILRGGQSVEIYANGTAITRPIRLEQPLTPVYPSLGLWQRGGHPELKGRAEFSRFTVWKLPAQPKP
jgi:hypothetical protein